MGNASWLGAAGGGGPMAAAAADAEEQVRRFVGLLPGGGGRPLFVDILQWELGLDQKRKVVVRGQERLTLLYLWEGVFLKVVLESPHSISTYQLPHHLGTCPYSQELKGMVL